MKPISRITAEHVCVNPARSFSRHKLSRFSQGLEAWGWGRGGVQGGRCELSSLPGALVRDRGHSVLPQSSSPLHTAWPSQTGPLPGHSLLLFTPGAP